MGKILVVDDEEILNNTLLRLLQQSGHHAECALTLTTGRQMVRHGNYDIVFLDVNLPDGNGLEYLNEFKNALSSPEVIIITGYGNDFGAELAILNDAWAYIHKPNLIKDLVLHVERALQYRKERNKKLVPILLKRDSIIGNSQPLTNCLNQVAIAAASDASVLITGKTGTGKELFARAIHDNSTRAKRNFVIVDCAALPANLVESTLFGHVQGSFTGANKDRKGLINHADGGTLFLDEVGELPLGVQKSFLRVLQDQTFRPVGSTKMEISNFRIIAATNRDLEYCISNGSFRSDLFFRLQAFSLQIPPLRNRKDDIKTLTDFFIMRLCERINIPPKTISSEFFESLKAYDWPGNIRELQQTLEQVFAATIEQSTLFANHLPRHFRVRLAKQGFSTDILQDNATELSPPEKSARPLPWPQCKQNLEKEYINDLMRYSQGKIAKACEISGLSRARIYQLRVRYGLT